MKRVLNILFSSPATVVLVILAAVAMASGTFIEDKYDTITARTLVYNTTWFEILFLLLALNFIGHIRHYGLLRKERIGGLTFHLAFIIMILGAGITRYFGYEGMMHIREGSSSNIIYSSEPYLRIVVGGKENYKKDFVTHFSPYTGNSFHTEIPLSTGKMDIHYKEYIHNALETTEENVAGGKDLLDIVVSSEEGRKRVFIEKGEVKNIGDVNIAFNNDAAEDAIKVTLKDSTLLITPPFNMTAMDMVQKTELAVSKDSTTAFRPNHLYTANELSFFFYGLHKSAIRKIIASPAEETGVDALLFDVTVNNKTTSVPLLFQSSQVAEYQDANIDNVDLKLGYGKKPIELPFSLYLKKFELDRYAGSESPSSYASEVTVLDNNQHAVKEHRIFMNNVLDYDNFRFFQSSYDQDEKGTILSVNHDFWGTLVSYIGYSLLALGFIITLFNPKSRFHQLAQNISMIRKMRKNMTAILIAGLAAFGLSASAQQSNSSHPVSPAPDAAHAEKFSHLITETFEGRFEPVHSLAFDVMHKISRKDKFEVEGKGKLNAVQVFLDMTVNPDFWKQQKIIYIREESVKNLLGITTKDAAFVDFFDSNGNYKLQSYAEAAFRKKPVDRNNFDKEVAKVDERVNIVMMTIQASMLRIYPNPLNPAGKWISWEEKQAEVPLKGVVNVINQDLQLPVLTCRSLTEAYFRSVAEANLTGNYSKADKILGYISAFQRQGSVHPLPSESKINAEIFYNKAQIFILLRNLYSVLSLCLLLLAFIENVRTKKSKVIAILLNVCIAVLAIGFLYQTFGMCLRAYLLGYAPWSNGYEALLLVGWGTLLAGFIFGRYSKITLAATSLLTFMILMTASHSSYDPQLTNLVPVLKSYWLIIHVALLTISYGFLGLGFVLGIMNLFLYIFKSRSNQNRLNLLITELTLINEMNLTIGIVLATIGTFLGGVWANESWGRYWGWDAKETWALIIVLTYTLLLHLRLVPKLSGKLFFNVGSVLSFGSVMMTFFGVNYFLSKGMHSYGAGDHAIFPLWGWIAILSIIALMIAAKWKDTYINKKLALENQ